VTCEVEVRIEVVTFAAVGVAAADRPVESLCDRRTALVAPVRPANSPAVRRELRRRRSRRFREQAFKR
jgi:hypothetical protein